MLVAVGVMIGMARADLIIFQAIFQKFAIHVV